MTDDRKSVYFFSALLATARNSFSSICSVTGQPLIPALFSRTQRGCRSPCTYRARRLPIEPVPCTGRQIRSTLLAICFIRATKEGSSGSQGRPNLRSAVCQTWATLCGKSVLERIVERLFLVPTHALVGMVRSTVRFAFRIISISPTFNASPASKIETRRGWLDPALLQRSSSFRSLLLSDGTNRLVARSFRHRSYRRSNGCILRLSSPHRFVSA